MYFSRRERALIECMEVNEINCGVCHDQRARALAIYLSICLCSCVLHNPVQIAGMIAVIIIYFFS